MRLFLLLLLFNPASALAIGASWPLSDTPRFWILGEGSGHLSLEGTYFQTKENYDSNGTVQLLPSLNRMYYYNQRLHGAYGFAPKVSLFVQTDMRWLIPRNEPSTASPENTNWGFGDTFLGIRWLIYRNRETDRVYPSEWSPNSWILLAEGTWNFPLYDRAKDGYPPLGEQSNDFSGILRAAWYTNEWLAFGAGVGYTHRTSSYAPFIPWNIRADFSFQNRHSFRLWADFKNEEGLRHNSGQPHNTAHPDPFPNGSLLFKSYAPTTRVAMIGGGYLVSRSWEVTGAAIATTDGIDTAKGIGFNLGITWRPYQVPEIKYEEYRQQQIWRLQHEKREPRRHEVVRYGFRATILKMSNQANYFRIAYGEKDRVKTGDTFYVLTPDDFSGLNRRPIAFARVVSVKPDAAFLRVEERYFKDMPIREGYEARRVYFDTEDQN